MTREEINNAVMEKLGMNTTQYGPQFTDDVYGWHCIFSYIVPWIKKQVDPVAIWIHIYEELPELPYTFVDRITDGEIFSLLSFVEATPVQICEAFLRATGNWTKEMEK